eukprot:scaffold30203_cov61-Cyclotella_meneghiniana.AAC.2
MTTSAFKLHNDCSDRGDGLCCLNCFVSNEDKSVNRRIAIKQNRSISQLPSALQTVKMQATICPDATQSICIIQTEFCWWVDTPAEPSQQSNGCHYRITQINTE